MLSAGSRWVTSSEESAELSVRGDRIGLPPPGAQGGAPGGAGCFAVIRTDGTEELLRPKQQHIPLFAGAGFVMRTSGGGGLGDPTTRDPERVADDVRDGRVSPQAAGSVYGVDLDGSGRASRGSGR